MPGKPKPRKPAYNKRVFSLFEKALGKIESGKPLTPQKAKAITFGLFQLAGENPDRARKLAESLASPQDLDKLSKYKPYQEYLKKAVEKSWQATEADDYLVKRMRQLGQQAKEAEKAGKHLAALHYERDYFETAIENLQSLKKKFKNIYGEKELRIIDETIKSDEEKLLDIKQKIKADLDRGKK